MAGKFYAVRIGRTPGIYMSWEDCRKMVDGYPKAEYKSFKTEEEAFSYLHPKEDMYASKKEDITEDYAFVDGSYNAMTKTYGYGGFLVHGGREYVLQGSGNEEEMASMRNVAGEVCGSMAAIAKAVELGMKELTILYDYMGIEMWARGDWKTNKQGTKAYAEYVASVKDSIRLRFVKVEAHTGIEGNERADMLAKEAVGL